MEDTKSFESPELAMYRESKELRAQLAQAIAAKESAVTMSEERLARALRAEDLLQLRAEVADDGALPAALHRAELAEENLRLARVERGLLQAAEARVKELEARTPGLAISAVGAEDRARRAEADLAEVRAGRDRNFSDFVAAHNRAVAAEARVRDLEARAKELGARTASDLAWLRAQYARCSSDLTIALERAEKAEVRVKELETRASGLAAGAEDQAWLQAFVLARVDKRSSPALSDLLKQVIVAGVAGSPVSLDRQQAIDLSKELRQLLGVS